MKQDCRIEVPFNEVLPRNLLGKTQLLVLQDVHFAGSNSFQGAQIQTHERSLGDEKRRKEVCGFAAADHLQVSEEGEVCEVVMRALDNNGSIRNGDRRGRANK